MATRDRRNQPRPKDPQTALTKRASSELTTPPAPRKHDDDQSAAIRASIDAARRQISDSLDDIQYSVQETLDWRGWVDEHPWQSVGLGVAAGFYLGLR